jgi:hypothetical protein
MVTIGEKCQYFNDNLHDNLYDAVWLRHLVVSHSSLRSLAYVFEFPSKRSIGCWRLNG